jgi:hypothetical protein
MSTPTRFTTKACAPKALELEDALLGHDAADQERDEHDDRHAPEGDLLELVCQRREPEPLRPHEDAEERRDNLAERADPLREVAAGADDRLARVGEHIDEPVRPLDRLGLKAAVSDLVQENSVLGLGADEIGLQPLAAEFVPSPVQHPSAKSVQTLDPG